MFHFDEKSDPPIVLNDIPNTMEILSGHNISMNCTAFGNPHPKVYWTKENHILSKSMHLNIMTKSSAESSGVYKCHASNSEGEDYLEIHVNVIGNLNQKPLKQNFCKK